MNCCHITGNSDSHNTDKGGVISFTASVPCIFSISFGLSFNLFQSFKQDCPFPCAKSTHLLFFAMLLNGMCTVRVNNYSY
jgi:hypothetical protein